MKEWNHTYESGMATTPFLARCPCLSNRVYSKTYKHSYKALRTFAHSSVRLDGPSEEKVRAIPFTQHVKAAEQVVYKAYRLH